MDGWMGKGDGAGVWRRGEREGGWVIVDGQGHSLRCRLIRYQSGRRDGECDGGR